jgi:hypothetical protein
LKEAAGRHLFTLETAPDTRLDKRDDRGRILDVHALRTTFGMLLSKGGVAPRTAQAAMRHSDIKLTMGVYTDPKSLDVRGALDALPALPLQAERSEAEAVRATGTDDEAARRFVPGFVPTLYKLVQTESSPDKTGWDGTSSERPSSVDVSSTSDKGKGRVSFPDTRPSQSGREDSNLRPPEPHSGALAKLRHAPSN